MKKLILTLFTLSLIESCQEGSDKIQRSREYELQREEEYNNRKTPVHPSDEIKE